MFDLADILHYQMNADEARAYKIAALWIELSRKAFPRYHHVGMPRRRDPRKSLLFKYAYKLLRETKGIIPDDEYCLYVQAQLDVLKALTAGKDGPRVEINCLVGDKAWRRWKLWKKHYDKNVRGLQTTDSLKGDSRMICHELDNARTYLDAMFNGQVPGEAEYSVRKADLARWVAVGRLSPYYAVLSPWVKKHVDLKNMSLDLGVYQKDITPGIEAHFKRLFPHEA
jgi:hypothetical protein